MKLVRFCDQFLKFVDESPGNLVKVQMVWDFACSSRFQAELDAAGPGPCFEWQVKLSFLVMLEITPRQEKHEQSVSKAFAAQGRELGGSEPSGPGA